MPTPRRVKDAASHARRLVNELDEQLGRYRAALDAGADPSVVAGWIGDAQARRLEAERQLRRPATKPDRMSRHDIEAIVATLGDVVATIREAHPEDKAEIYGRLGV